MRIGKTLANSFIRNANILYNINMKNKLLSHFLTMLAGVVLALIILAFIQPTLVNGDSMSPYLEDGDYLIMNKTAYENADPDYGDVIVFKNDGKLLIKRVIGKPGDSIEIKDGNVYRNGELIDDYVDIYTEPEVSTELDYGEFFVLGDNREVSLDSRFPDVGNVQRSTICGRVILRLFPNFGII